MYNIKNVYMFGSESYPSKPIINYQNTSSSSLLWGVKKKRFRVTYFSCACIVHQRHFTVKVIPQKHSYYHFFYERSYLLPDQLFGEYQFSPAWFPCCVVYTLQLPYLRQKYSGRLFNGPRVFFYVQTQPHTPMPFGESGSTLVGCSGRASGTSHNLTLEISLGINQHFSEVSYLESVLASTPW